MMSFHLYVQQNRWIVVALLAGVVLLILFCLTYWAMWRPREEESRVDSQIRIVGPVSFFKWLLAFMPWPLMLLIIGTLVYGATHLLLAMTQLSNW